MMKVFLTVGVYLGLVLALGFVLAMITPRERLEFEPGDDEL